MHRHHKKKRSSKCSKSRSQSVASNFLTDDGSVDSCNENGRDEKTFYVKTSKVMGRYMVASRDLTPGSVIISELPLVIGPCTGCKVQCIACYQPLEENFAYSKCLQCGWPLCSPHCQGLGKYFGHTATECAVLKECKSASTLNYDDFDSMKENFNAVVPLRCLILKESSPKIYEQILTMEHHNDIRRNIPELWALNQIGIVDKIRNDWGLVEFSDEEIHSICGILEVNCFEIGQQGISMRGLYPSAFLMSHDCVPNTSHSDEEKDYRLTVRASTIVYADQPITLSYAYTLQGTLKRREHLLENKFFECQCNRCRDPTELGTYTSALQCPKCKCGLVLSTNPLDNDSSWSCNNKSKKPDEMCPGYIVSSRSMGLLIDRIQNEIDEIDCNDLLGMEHFLEKYRNVLHPTHYLCLGIKLSLSQLYGKINGYEIHELSDEMLYRKMEICREILKIFDVVEPGFTRIRGVTLYELHAPIMILTSRQFARQQISKNELRVRLREVARYLQDASVILGYEPENSSEGMIGVAAKDALAKTKDWGKIIGKI